MEKSEGGKKVVQCNWESHKSPHSQCAGIHQVKRRGASLYRQDGSRSTVPVPQQKPIQKTPQKSTKAQWFYGDHLLEYLINHHQML